VAIPVVVFTRFIELDTLTDPPTLRVPPIPTPPVTTNDPVVEDVEAVEDKTDTIPPIVFTSNLLLSDPSLTWNAVALELLRVITPVLVIVPVFVIAPLFKITPDIEEALEEDVNKLPPIPTPPDTMNAPEDVDVEFVVFVIETVPPINELPVTPKPPETCNEPVDVEDEFIDPLPILVNPPNSLIVTV
jgi:hypothetical protein